MTALAAVVSRSHDVLFDVRGRFGILASSQSLRVTTERRIRARERNAFELGKDAQRMTAQRVDTH